MSVTIKVLFQIFLTVLKRIKLSILVFKQFVERDSMDGAQIKSSHS